MSGWALHEGLTVALAMENIDTDQLVPARFMSTPRAQGYGGFLLHDMRHDGQGRPLADFPLDRPEARGASILLTRRNFGAGSSREAAVYALVDAGFRVVVAPSFGDIFAGNAVNNGLLALRLAEPLVEALIAVAPSRLTVDLEQARLHGTGLDEEFELDEVARTKLTKGWDDIDLTASNREAIAGFARRRQGERPWLWPTATQGG